MNAEQIKTAKTAELVAFYNAHADKKVSKFQDRATAERRVAELVASLADVAPVKATIGSTDQSGDDVHGFAQHGRTHCPHCGIHLSNGVGTDGDEVNGKIIRQPYQFECLACGEGFGTRTKVGKTVNNSTGVQLSWNLDHVRKARSTRNGVQIDWTSEDGKHMSAIFKSVAAAFKARGLPMSKHVKFRAELKKNGTAEAFGFYWIIIE